MTTKFSSNASTVRYDQHYQRYKPQNAPTRVMKAFVGSKIFRRSALRARREPDQFLTSDRGILSALRSTELGSDHHQSSTSQNEVPAKTQVSVRTAIASF